jgi:hypothetical protein
VTLSERFLVELADCEQVRDGLLAQPVNATSSLAYLAAGAAVLTQIGARGPGKRLRTAAFGTAITLNGLGSVLYHGWPHAWTHWVHDVAIVALLASPIAIDAGRFRRWSDGRVAAAIAALTAAGGLVLYALPGSTNTVTVVLGGVALGFELATATVARRRGRSAFGSRPVTWAAATGLGLSLVGNAAGRSGSPLCAPESILQGHAGWHALGAVVAAAFATLVLDRPDDLLAGEAAEPELAVTGTA